MIKKICILLCCSLMVTVSHGQFSRDKKRKGASAFNMKAKKNKDEFLQKQWWLGLKAGANWTKPSVVTPYSVITATNYDPSSLNKSYKSFNRTGTQAALEITFYFKRFSLTLQPTYQHSRFIYSNTYMWADTESTQNTLILHYVQQQETDHAVIPLMARYDLTETKLRPYVQAGGYIAMIINANKSVTITGEDYASGGLNELSSDPIIVGAKELFAKSYLGLAGGFGVNYHQGNIRINLDFLYQHGMSSATSVKNRYSNDRLVGVGDVMDDLTLDNIVISLGCLFPLRFLEDSFKSMDK